MNDVAAWVHGGSASHLIWVDGGWDPWTGGQFDITGATDAVKVTVPQATHGALLTALPAADQATTFAMLQAWTGVAPDAAAVNQLRSFQPRAPEVRPPPALIRAMQLRAH
jgi:PS-10 peptidase S37